jgi:hypothetical protein
MGGMARYPEYADLPAHIRGMLRAISDDDDAKAERYAHAPNKNLEGRSVMFLVNAWFGQRVVESFLYDLGNYLGVDDMDRFKEHFGKKR